MTSDLFIRYNIDIQNSFRNHFSLCSEFLVRKSVTKNELQTQKSNPKSVRLISSVHQNLKFFFPKYKYFKSPQFEH